MNLDQAACAFGHISPDQWGGRGLQVLPAVHVPHHCMLLVCHTSQHGMLPAMLASKFFNTLQVAAVSDVAPDYTGSCGRCYELRCANMNFSVSLEP